MKKTFDWQLILMGACLASLLILSGCFQSTPESPQQAVEEKVSQLSLAGTAWRVESFGGPNDTIPVLPDTPLTVNYLVERYAGSGGCNWYVGVYTTDGSSLRMETPATTSLICEPAGIMQQEGTFMSSLLNTTEYKMEGNKLLAYTVENQQLLTLVPAQPSPFEGTTWDLKLIYTGKEWRPVIPLSTVTAQFEGDQMSGSGGCNTYKATVTREDEALTISNLSSAEKACTDPVGVMDQETKYLSMLSSVTGYQAAGHALALVDADGQAILLFGAE
jgi:heat shock protein HslJ